MDQIASDHPAVDSVRSRVGRHGGNRRRLEVEPGILPDIKHIRTVVDGNVRFGSISRQQGDDDWITGVYDSPRLARSGSGEDYLPGWLATHGRGIGDSVWVDIITHEYAIGIRPPGERVVYPVVQSPGTSLDAIARSLDE